MGCCCRKHADDAAVADEHATLLGGEASASASASASAAPAAPAAHRRRSLGYGTHAADDARWGPRAPPKTPKTQEKSGLVAPSASFRHRSLKRMHILLEIVSTEKSYRDDLHAMLDHVLIPLRSRGDLIRRAQLESIFAGWEVIASVSEDLCERLESSTTTTTATATATATVITPTADKAEDDKNFERALEAFCAMSDFLKAIGAFCAGYDRAVASLADAEKASSDLRAYFQAFQHGEPEASHGLAIRSFLIKPIQRVTKYPLFFRELLKYTKHDHPLYGKLVQAKARIEELVCQVDARVAKQHELTKSSAVIKLLGGQQKRLGFLLAPGRHFLFHLHCQVRTHKASHALLRSPNRKFKDGLLIGLTDRLLLCRPQMLGRLRVKHDKACSTTGIEGSWRLKSYLELEGLRISNLAPVLEEIAAPSADEDEGGGEFVWGADGSEGGGHAPPAHPAPLPEILRTSKNHHIRRTSSTPDLPPRPMFAKAPPIPAKDKAYEVRRRSIAPGRSDQTNRKRATTGGASKRRSLTAPPIPPKRSSLSFADSDASEHAQSLRENFGTLYLSNIFKEGETFGQVHTVEPDVVYEVSMPTDKLVRFRAQIQEARFVCELSAQDLESRRNHLTGGASMSSSTRSRKKKKL